MPFLHIVAQIVMPPRYLTITVPRAQNTDPMPWYTYPTTSTVERPSSVATREEMILSLSPQPQRKTSMGRIERMMKTRRVRESRKGCARKRVARGKSVSKRKEAPGVV